MYLTPKEKEIGRENFRKATQDGLSRRDFLKSGITAGVVSGGSLGAFYFGYEASVGNPLRVGVIGTGDEGCVLIGAINPDYIQVKAIADLRPYNIHRAFHGHYRSDGSLVAPRPGLLRKYAWKTEDEAREHVKVYEGEKGDYRELIANAKQDGIEAVIIALPLHLHAPAAIAAMEAELHVLTEKLMAHSVGECKQMARAANETRRHLATGHQRHYNILYSDAVETIKRGILGELHYIRAQWHRGNMPHSDSWKMPLPPGVKTLDEDPNAEKLLKDLKSWEKKLAAATSAGDRDKAQRMVDQLNAQIEDKIVEAAKFEYQDAKWKMADGKTYRRPALEELIRWRLWDRTGGGLMAELGSHQLDAASIFISAAHGGPDKVRPLSVLAAGNRPIFGQDRDVDDHVCCIFEFPAPGYDPHHPLASRKKIGVQYASINGNGFGGYGEIVFGTKGTLILEREQDAMLYNGGAATKIGASGGGGTMDTQESPGAMATAAAQTGPAAVSRGYAEELEHWAWCIRRNPDVSDPNVQPKCHPKVALADAVIALSTNIAAETGERVEFKEGWFDPDVDAVPEKDIQRK